MTKIKLNLPLEKAHRIISPRIGYIVTTVDAKGLVNAAVFSNLTSVSTKPERLVLAVYKPWDTIRNIRQTKEFVVNVPHKNLMEKVWICGDKYAGNPIPPKINELKVAALTEIHSKKVRPPRVAECSMHLECKVKWIKDVGNHYLVLGEVVAASYTKGVFNGNWRQVVSKTKPLLEIGGGLFTYPEKEIRVNQKKVHAYVAKWLDKKKIRVSRKLEKYNGFKRA